MQLNLILIQLDSISINWGLSGVTSMLFWFIPISSIPVAFVHIFQLVFLVTD